MQSLTFLREPRKATWLNIYRSDSWKCGFVAGRFRGIHQNFSQISPILHNYLLIIKGFGQRSIMYQNKGIGKSALSVVYSIVPIKRTVLLNVLFQKIPNVSIKRTVFSEKWWKNIFCVLFLLNILLQKIQNFSVKWTVF